ncbi:MAG: hypothetical protein HZA27_01845, partial [Candidatus Omnitrophica bacterium]|nr:hypothetical protein [Candidatus Omnitrophota bacterium]
MTVKRQSEKLETIIKDTTKFSLASYLANIFDFFSGIVTRSILGPLTMGVFAELMLIFQYAKYYHLGTYEALDREIPYFNGRQDFHRVKEIKGVAFNFSFLISVIFGISLVIISNFLKDNKLIFGLRFIAILVMLQSMVTFFII